MLQNLPQLEAREGRFAKKKKKDTNICSCVFASGLQASITHPPRGQEGWDPPPQPDVTSLRRVPVHGWIPTRGGVIQPHSFLSHSSSLHQAHGSVWPQSLTMSLPESAGG